MDTSHIDLVELVQRDVPLKRVAGTQGGEYHGPCPLCGGKDRFLVQRNRNGKGGRWMCRQCYQTWSDAIEYLKHVKGMPFQSAIESLGLSNTSHPVRNRRTSSPQPAAETRISSLSDKPSVALTSMKWQRQAYRLAGEAFDMLWSPEGESAREYLHNRGLIDQIIVSAGLGLIPKTSYQPRADWGIPVEDGDKPNTCVPAGILIPWLIGDGKEDGARYWRLNIRRFEGDLKYFGPAGFADGLYFADQIYQGCTVIMTEGEFDTLVIRSQALDLVQQRKGIIPVATGSTCGARKVEWLCTLAMARRVLVAFDTDDPGNSGAEWWLKTLGPKARRLMPTQHDVTDMFKAGDDIRSWILDAMD